jgi:hypothetical protein
MGVGYEFIMFAGKHDNFFTRILSAPGLWVQRLTTKEPTLDMLEVAICSTKCALRDDFSEFKEYFDAKGWEKKVDEDISSEGDGTAEASSETVTGENEENGTSQGSEEYTAPENGTCPASDETTEERTSE